MITSRYGFNSKHAPGTPGLALMVTGASEKLETNKFLRCSPQLASSKSSFHLAGFWYVIQLNNALETHLTIKGIHN